MRLFQRISPVLALAALSACGAGTPTGTARGACEQRCDTQQRACESACSPKSEAVDTCSEHCDTEHASCLANCK